MKYHILPDEPLQSGDYTLITLRHQDVQKIRIWRNEQIRYLRQRWEISETQQENYWEREIFPTFDKVQPAQVLLSFMQRQRCIGYGGLVHIDWQSRRAEVSFLLETSRMDNALTFQNEFGIFLSLIKQLAFKQMKLNKLTAETFDIRPLHLQMLEKSGFVKEGCLRQQINLSPDDDAPPQYVDSILHGLLAGDL